MPIKDNYIVRFVDGANAAGEAAALAGRGSQVDRIYRNVFAGALVRLPEQAVEALRRNPRVASVEADRLVSTDGVQTTPPWGSTAVISGTALPRRPTTTPTPGQG
jgi:hypothetical protein